MGLTRKGEKRPPGAGRKRGTPNKTTVAAKEAFMLAFQGIGGVPALQTWAQGNPDEFYKLFARLIPVDVQGSGLKGEMVMRVEFVRAKDDV